MQLIYTIPLQHHRHFPLVQRLLFAAQSSQQATRQLRQKTFAVKFNQSISVISSLPLPSRLFWSWIFFSCKMCRAELSWLILSGCCFGYGAATSRKPAFSPRVPASCGCLRKDCAPDSTRSYLTHRVSDTENYILILL